MCLPIAVLHPELVLGEGKYLGYEWNITIGPMGHRCGYVRVDKGHPWHGQDYNGIEASVHGSLTFAEKDMPCAKGGEDDGYWVGFDCAHMGDRPDPELLPRSPHGAHLIEMEKLAEKDPETAKAFAILKRLQSGNDFESVKSQDYVINECKSLIRQARKAAKQ